MFGDDIDHKAENEDEDEILAGHSAVTIRDLGTIFLATFRLPLELRKLVLPPDAPKELSLEATFAFQRRLNSISDRTTEALQNLLHSAAEESKEHWLEDDRVVALLVRVLSINDAMVSLNNESATELLDAFQPGAAKLLSGTDSVISALVCISDKILKETEERNKMLTAVVGSHSDFVANLQRVSCTLSEVQDKCSKFLAIDGDLPPPLLQKCYRTLEQELARKSEATSKLIVVGETSSGKSSLINVLVDQGYKLVPSAQGPTSFALCEIANVRAGGLPSFAVWHPDADVVCSRRWWDEAIMTDQSNIDWSKPDRIQSALSQHLRLPPSNDHGKHMPPLARLQIQADILKSGLTIVDSPGLNDDKDRDPYVYTYLADAVALIVMIHADKGVTEKIRFLIDTAVNKAAIPSEAIMFVGTHFPATGWEPLAARICDTLQTILPAWNPEQFAVCNLKQAYRGISGKHGFKWYSPRFVLLLRKMNAFFNEIYRLRLRRLCDVGHASFSAFHLEASQLLDFLSTKASKRATAIEELKGTLADITAKFNQSKSLLATIAHDSWMEKQQALAEFIRSKTRDLLLTKSEGDDMKLPPLPKPLPTRPINYWTTHVVKELRVSLLSRIQSRVNQMGYDVKQRLLAKVLFVVQEHKELSTILSVEQLRDAPLQAAPVLPAVDDYKPPLVWRALGIIPNVVIIVPEILSLFQAKLPSRFYDWASSRGWTEASVLADEKEFRRAIALRYAEIITDDADNLAKESCASFATSSNSWISEFLSMCEGQLRSRLDKMTKLINNTTSGDTYAAFRESLDGIHKELELASWLAISPLRIGITRLQFKLQDTGAPVSAWPDSEWSVAHLMHSESLLPPSEVMARTYTVSFNRSQFVTYIRALANLAHPTVVKFYGVCDFDDDKLADSENSKKLLVLERCNNSLVTWLQSPACTSLSLVDRQQRALTFAMDILQALRFLNEKECSFGRIMLEDIFITPHGNGIAKLGNLSKVDVTRVSLGSDPEISNQPELKVAPSASVSNRSVQDIPYFAVFLWKLLTFVEKGETTAEDFSGVLQEVATLQISPTLSDFWRHICQLVLRCLPPNQDPELSWSRLANCLPHAGTEQARFFRPLRILSIDGGGSRGIIPIEILSQLSRVCGDRPIHECFDLICGTSVGAFLACNFGIAQRSIAEIRQNFLDLAGQIFGGAARRNLFLRLLGQSKYTADALDRFLKATFEGRKMSEYPRDSRNKPKVFATTRLCPAEDNEYLLRNYVVPAIAPRGELAQDWKISEVCRAASAAPFYFPSYELNGQSYGDAGTSFNNPVKLALREVQALYPNVPLRESIAVIVSVGTGRSNALLRQPTDLLGSIFSEPATIIQAMKQAMTGSEAVHGEMLADLDLPRGAYFRFNPELPQEAKLDASTSMELGTLQQAAFQYLEHEQDRLCEVAKLLGFDPIRQVAVANLNPSLPSRNPSLLMSPRTRSLFHEPSIPESCLATAVLKEDLPTLTQMLDESSYAQPLLNEGLIAACHSGKHEHVRALLKTGADRNAEFGSGSALQHAIQGGHLLVVQELLSESKENPLRTNLKAALSMAARFGQLPLVQFFEKLPLPNPLRLSQQDATEAAKAGHLNIVQHFCNGQPPIQLLSDFGEQLPNPLLAAVQADRPDIFEFLAVSQPQLATFPSGNSLFHTVIQHNATKLLDLLLRVNLQSPWLKVCIKGASFDTHFDTLDRLGTQKNTDGMTPLDLAVSLGSLTMVNRLLQYPKLGFKHSPSLLYHAICYDRVDLFKQFLESKDPVYQSQTVQVEALFHAAAKGHLQLFNDLHMGKYASGRSSRINLKVISEKKEDLLSTAITNGRAAVVTALAEKVDDGVWLLQHLEQAVARHNENLVQPLLHAIGPYHRTSNGKTSLHFLAAGGTLESVKFLVDKKLYDVSRADADGRLAAHEAARAGGLDVLDFLLSKGKSLVNKADRDGNTCAHLVLLSRSNADQVTFLECLARHGANFLLNGEKSPLFIAMKSGITPVKLVEAMLPAGATDKLSLSNRIAISRLAIASQNLDVCRRFAKLLDFVSSSSASELSTFCSSYKQEQKDPAAVLTFFAHSNYQTAVGKGLMRADLRFTKSSASDDPAVTRFLKFLETQSALFSQSMLVYH